MFGNHLRLAQAQFASQFTKQDGKLVYRRWSKGPAYAVSPEQRKKWTQDFKKRQLWLWPIFTMLLIAGLAVIIGIDLFLFDETELDEPLIFIQLAILFVPLMTWTFFENHRSFTRPAGDLEREVPVAVALSTEEWRKSYLADISWKNLLFIPPFSFLLVLGAAAEYDIWNGWGRLIWLVPLALCSTCVVQAFRKWRIERGNAQ